MENKHLFCFESVVTNKLINYLDYKTIGSLVRTCKYFKTRILNCSLSEDLINYLVFKYNIIWCFKKLFFSRDIKFI